VSNPYIIVALTDVGESGDVYSHTSQKDAMSTNYAYVLRTCNLQQLCDATYAAGDLSAGSDGQLAKTI